jgi:hypothetical protein
MKVRGDLNVTATDCRIINMALGELLALAKIDRDMLTPEEKACARRLQVRSTVRGRQLTDRV